MLLGSLLAFEAMCLLLGSEFEPYGVDIFPNLLLCFGDTNAEVRKAADDAANAVINKLSAHGVRMVMLQLQNKCVHAVNAVSVIMLVVEHTFREESTELRKIAAQVIGNMYSAIDQKVSGTV